MTLKRINLNMDAVVLQSPSHMPLFATPWTAARQASLSLTISRSLPKFMSIPSVTPFNRLILSRPLLPLDFPSIRVFSSKSALRIKWPKYWSFSFSISLSNEHSGLISFRIDQFDLRAVQRTLKSLLQHYSLKAPVLWCSTFFIVQHHNWKGPSLASPPSASMGYTLREGHWVMTKWWVLSHSKASWKKT